MDNLEVLQKDITETKYLATENTYRYRPIMRLFYREYEKAHNWIYKEEIYNDLKDKIPDYELEDLERDLTVLVENGSLTTVQDVKNIQTLEDFKNKKFRYQMTDYAITIERMTIELEEMEVKVSSLSPRRFEILKHLIQELKNIDLKSLEEFNELWQNITSEFKDLNQNYQDFLKKFQESKTEELLESNVFLEYKNKMINYLQDFIKGYLINGNKIKETLLNLDEDIETKIIQKLEDYQRSIPKINQDFNYTKFNDLNRGKFHSLKNWFVPTNEKSEGDRLLDITNSIITQITKAASSLVELHGNMIARKEEYKYLCKLFDSKTNIKDSHKLASVIFGVTNVIHYKGYSNLNTDSLVQSYEVPATIIEVEPHEKRNRGEKKYSIITSKAEEKKKILNAHAQIEKEEQKILLKLVKKGQIKLDDTIELTTQERKYILNLIARKNNKNNKENVLGLTYDIEKLPGKCRIVSPDGIFTMDSIILTFKERGEQYHE